MKTESYSYLIDNEQYRYYLLLRDFTYKQIWNNSGNADDC
ncbi:hypothetical protein EC2860050_1840 [Escherichia coli 2860050]|nr:hypothetical protein EC2860050_3412 [Escherichia coli 2860050]EMV94753.1 hypothetical protein EC2860050_1840 [Escherichia coli 2860050]